jgi:hypothetical protein
VLEIDSSPIPRHPKTSKEQWLAYYSKI